MDFDLSAAVDPGSKKPEGTCQVGNPKHCPLKAPGRPEAGGAHKPRHGSGSSSDSSSSSSSDSEGEGKKRAPGCEKHEKAKRPKVKKEKKEKKKEKKAPH
ncbi:hypothetical protein STEG23_020308 [Scotinomys teguina]